MTRQEFLLGLKVFWSCGGNKEDKETLEVWYRMLQDLDPKDFEQAIMDICQTKTELSGFSFNFVAEVKSRARSYRSRRKNNEWKQHLLEEVEMVPPEKIKAFIAEFTGKLK